MNRRRPAEAPVGSADLTAIVRDASELDVLASGGHPMDPAVALLADLRRALDGVPGGQVRGGRSRRRSALRRGVAVGTVALALPLATVTGAAAAAHPGDPLYPVRRAVIGRTADDPWHAEQLVSQARSAIRAAETTWPTADPAKPLSRAEDLLTEARKAVPRLHGRDAIEISARIRRLEQRIQTAEDLKKHAAKTATHAPLAATHRESRPAAHRLVARSPHAGSSAPPTNDVDPAARNMAAPTREPR